MSKNCSPLTMLTRASSRREVMRLAGAGVVVLAAASRQPGVLAQTPFPTRLRVLHASPQLGKIEVHINGQEELDEFTYGKVSDWIEVSPGTARFTIHRDRAGINYVVYDAYVPAVPDQDYDLIIADPLLNEPVLLPTPVDRSPLPANTARLAAIHASVALPAVDLAQKGGAVLASNLLFGQRSVPREMAAGAYDLEVRAHDSGQVVLDLPGTTLEAGQVSHLVIYGDPGSAETPLTSVSLTDAAHTAATATPSA